MSYFKALFVLAAVLSLVALASPASATHKNWQLKNTGSQCHFTSYTTSEPPAADMSLNNYTSQPRFAVCPVTLAGRWGSSANPVNAVPRWAAAMSAKVIIAHNNTAGLNFDCTLRARLATEALYYSATAFTNTTGSQALNVATNSQWGGTLEAQQLHTVRSMDFYCFIPPQEANGSASYIDAYQVKICQVGQSCNDNNAPTHEGPAQEIVSTGHYNHVQTSGFECTVGDYHEANNFQRGYVGIKNAASYSIGVFCPITQPSDDSGFHDRLIFDAKVHYSSPTANTPIPTCQLRARSWGGNLFPLQGYDSSLFTAGSGADAGTVVQPQQQNGLAVHKDLSMGIWCGVQPGQTIKGVTARLSQTEINGGGS